MIMKFLPAAIEEYLYISDRNCRLTEIIIDRIKNKKVISFNNYLKLLLSTINRSSAYR